MISAMISLRFPCVICSRISISCAYEYLSLSSVSYLREIIVTFTFAIRVSHLYSSIVVLYSGRVILPTDEYSFDILSTIPGVILCVYTGTFITISPVDLDLTLAFLFSSKPDY